MNRVKTEAIIYKLLTYSDRSAIGFLFTREYGVIKVFISRAFGKKGGVFKFLPGTVDFLLKESSGLHKFYGFEPNIKYYFFIENPYILVRLNLIFKLLDEFGLDYEHNNLLWKMILGIRNDNIYKSTVYITYFILKHSGFLSEINCYECGKKRDLLLQDDGTVKCKKCCAGTGIVIEDKIVDLFKLLENARKYKATHIDKRLEKLYMNYIKNVVTQTLKKSFKVFDILYI
ncbi:DNA repair protein RecO [Deferribacter abyssi]|uniref:DNA repair protein RecO n=1 Tax=Deferribacter abyssi TaxID=213806 RepID=UPI003C1E4A38